jgi:hypothetical protein
VAVSLRIPKSFLDIGAYFLEVGAFTIGGGQTVSAAHAAPGRAMLDP